jgi:hypothetical protein
MFENKMFRKIQARTGELVLRTGVSAEELGHVALCCARGQYKGHNAHRTWRGSLFRDAHFEDRRIDGI